jgi:DNA-binding IclR family transcriptional regulator
MIQLVASSPKTLGEVAEHFDVHKTTVLRQLQSIESAGFVLRHKDGRYGVGVGLIATAQIALDRMDLRDVASDELRSLHVKTGNTLHLAQLIGSSIVYVDKVDDVDGVRMYSRVGKTVPAYCTGVGKVILAQLSRERIDEVLESVEWVRHTATTIPDRASLDAELKLIRSRGWGVDDGEFEDFGNCIAVPITNSTGSIVGALSLTAIKMVKSIHALQVNLPDLLNTSREISRVLA